MTDKKEAKKPNKIAQWWRETIGEMRKVSWPTLPEARRLTWIVLVVMLAMSTFLGLLDFVFSRLVTLLYS
ncbi:MAG: preprotein translocase subunit SecE [Anaerolineae bacterium]|nr:preprotein translocase subunit SecE [Anaerolineae bacterium]